MSKLNLSAGEVNQKVSQKGTVLFDSLYAMSQKGTVLFDSLYAISCVELPLADAFV